MALSDTEIWAEIGAGRLIIDPMPDPDRIIASTIDLLLAAEITEYPRSEEIAAVKLDASATSLWPTLQRLGTKHDLSGGEPFVLKPNSFILAKTLESITIPDHLAGRVEGKSTLARAGLGVHVTAPTIHPGFKGPLILEMFNVGPFQLELRFRMKICQITLEHLGLPATRPYRGQYKEQR